MCIRDRDKIVIQDFSCEVKPGQMVAIVGPTGAEMCIRDRDEDGNMVIGDEMLTPDSSRFWPAEGYEPGHSQPSFDKQFARDWLKANPDNDWTPVSYTHLHVEQRHHGQSGGFQIRYDDGTDF